MTDGGHSGSQVRKKARNENGIDRLSELPDSILRHALSFLSSKSAVQTSVLSRRWRSVWKGVPVLNFDSTSGFKSNRDLRRFASKILTQRYDATKVLAIRLELGYQRRSEFGRQDALLFEKLFNYAASHGVQHLRIADSGSAPLFSSDRDTISGLETLDLTNVFLEEGFAKFPAFKTVTALTLVSCKRITRLGPSHIFKDEPFVDFPNLKNLTLKHCAWEDDPVLWIANLYKLLCLRIEMLSVKGIFISAPNLTSFYYRGDLGSPELYKPFMPSLERAYIEIRPPCHSRGGIPGSLVSAADHEQLITLLEGLQSAKTLELHLNTLKVFERLSASPECQTTPFTRLKTLILNLENEGESFDMPYWITHYFLGNPINKEAKSTKFKVTRRC